MCCILMDRPIRLVYWAFRDVHAGGLGVCCMNPVNINHITVDVHAGGLGVCCMLCVAGLVSMFKTFLKGLIFGLGFSVSMLIVFWAASEIQSFLSISENHPEINFGSSTVI
jgi:hypothetical protein